MTSSTLGAAEPVAGGFWSVMRYRNYALLWTGQLISQLGDRLHWMAISLWVYRETGSALSVSFAIMALLVGSAVVGIPAGVLVDRLDRRKILIYGDLLRAALVFAIPDLMERSIVSVYVVLFLISSVTAFFRPAMFASIPQSVPRDRLLQANSLFASMDSGTEIVGPALAGIVVSTLGYKAALYLDALTFLISGLLVSSLKMASGGTMQSGAGSVKLGGLIRAAVEGFEYIRGDRIQVALLALVLGGYWVAGLNSLQTPMAKGVLRITDQQFGWFQSSGGAGYVVASLLLGWFGTSLGRGRIVVAAYFLWAFAVAAVALSTNVGVFVVANFWTGFANMLVFISVATILMEYTPSDKLGRAITTRQILVALMRTTSLVVFGWLADAVGVRFSILTMAILSAAGTLLAALRFPALWDYRMAVTSTTQLRVGVAGSLERHALPSLLAYLASRSSPEFVVDEQVWLNAISIAMVSIAWLLLIVILPFQAFALAAVVVGTILAATSVRRLVSKLGNRGNGNKA